MDTGAGAAGGLYAGAVGATGGATAGPVGADPSAPSGAVGAAGGAGGGPVGADLVVLLVAQLVVQLVVLQQHHQWLANPGEKCWSHSCHLKECHEEIKYSLRI